MSTLHKESIAVVWDIENVTPSINSTFIKGVLDYVRSEGRLAVARVYGDWSRASYENTAEQLVAENFDCIHLPRSAKEKVGAVISEHTMELATIYPHITTLVLVTGKASFTGVIKKVAAYGVGTKVICDAKNAEEELLLSADEFKDFRDLTVVPLEEPGEEEREPVISLEESFILLREAVRHIEERKKLATVENVRVRLKLMNERFDEEKLGFDSWQAYLAEAEKRGIVYIRFRDQSLVVSIQRQKAELPDCSPTIISHFLSALQKAGKTRTSEGSRAKLLDTGEKLREAGMDYHDHGYSRLKKVADAAAKRGLVSISLKESNYLLGLTKRGEEYLKD